MELKERMSIFKDELDLISRKEVKDFVKACIAKAPDYVFEDCPSSSSGKYHPIEELGADGTLIHTKKVSAVAYEFSRALDCENHRDEIVAAAILHDMAKQGLESAGHTVREHPRIMSKIIAGVYNDGFKDKLNKTTANLIYWSVFYHYGPWTEESVRKPLREYTPEELSVYMADYIVSKRFVHIDYKRML